MKIFAIYLRLSLDVKPTWFDDVRGKYSSTSILHITLIQPRYVSASEVQGLKDKVSQVLSRGKFDDKKLIFSKTELEWDEDDNKYLLMSFIKDNQSIASLQKSLVEALKEFDNYCSESTREYEVNFRPHLTIANQISVGSKDEMAKLVSENPIIEESVTDLVLSVVNELSIPESENPSNWIVFQLI